MAKFSLRKKKLWREDQLCAWNDPDNPLPLCQYSEKQTVKEPVKSNSVSNLKKSTSSSSTTHKFKSSKWYLKHKKDSELSTKYVFKHFTDCHRYIEDYREEKVKKMKEYLGEDYVNQFSSIQANPIPSHVVDNNKRNAVCLQPTNENLNNISFAYHTQKSKRILNTCCQNIRRDVVDGSPMKVRGGKCFNYDQNDVRPMEYEWNKRVSLKSSVCMLPKCEPFYLPNKSISFQQTDNSLKPEHLLQCKRLNELSVSSSLEQKSFQAQGWRPQPIKTREKVRSANEKKRSEQITRSNYDNYTHIIKRVLEHYDPSNNPIRGSVNKTNEAKTSYLLASTY